MDTFIILAICLALAIGGRWLMQHSGSVLGVTSVLLTLLLTYCGMLYVTSKVAEVHYRVSVSVAVDGELKSAEAVQGIRYNHAGDANGKRAITALPKGSAPLIDLGNHGMLVVAVEPDFNEWFDRQKRYFLSCSRPESFVTLFERTMGIDDHRGDLKRDGSVLKGRLAALPKMPQTLGPQPLPAFIWFPTGAGFRQGQQICPEEFNRVIGARVELRSITMEAVPTTIPIDSRIKKPATWLAELRNEKATGRPSNEAYARMQQIEMNAYW